MLTYLSLGTNLGDKRHNLDAAIIQIEKRIGTVLRQSAFIETEPWGYDSDNTFLNACVACDTTLTPEELLDITQAIERDLGRTAKSTDGTYHDRIIDIDILLYEDRCIDTPRLHIPHPLMLERDFVMIPLLEIYEGDKTMLYQ